MAIETKFTPGPWFINRSEMGIHKYVEARIGGGMIQEVACCGPTELHEQSDANARLIAAAPELLHVAQMVYDAEMDWRSEGHQSIPDYALETIRAAIAKATGEQE